MVSYLKWRDNNAEKQKFSIHLSDHGDRTPGILQQAPMNTSYAISSDGRLIAYERYGADPTVILLHDGGGCRQEWREAGYIERLQNDFTVITLELRGHGESSPSTNLAAYTVAKMIQDILAVADACRVEQFTLRGMSHEGKAGRYLAVHSGQVKKFILMSAPLMPGTSPRLCQEIAEFTVHWSPVLACQPGTQPSFLAMARDSDL